MISEKAKIGENTRIWFPELSNIGACTIGDNTVVHAGVHIHDGVEIGNYCQIEAQVFIPTGVKIKYNVFVGPGVIFTNDPNLKQTGSSKGDWKPTPTTIESNVKIGAGARILAGITVGRNSVVGMGAVVLDDVPENTTVVGIPAKPIIRKTG
jgi:acetyltransferase-like isoleucine patch superfamily enzyme